MTAKDFRDLLARAEAGEAQGQYDLGLRCLSGDAAAPDYSGALSWFRLAALQGHALAQYELGRLYESGAGAGRDIGKALRWYRRAADQGAAEARSRLLDFFAALGEAAYDRMYEVGGAGATAAYSDAKEAFVDAIALARLLARSAEVERLEQRLAQVKAVFRNQFP